MSLKGDRFAHWNHRVQPMTARDDLAALIRNLLANDDTVTTSITANEVPTALTSAAHPGTLGGDYAADMAGWIADGIIRAGWTSPRDERMEKILDAMGGMCDEG